jgi:bifunctional UDP-N-acetylglucosamine pyrophosphorylase/glucosamine-1-phosphate N-acetyltransferase
MTQVGIVVMAAGKGTRMRSVRPKVLHEAAGRSLIDRVLDTAAEVAPVDRTSVVIGHGAESVGAHIAERGVGTRIQEPQLGTGDALRVGLGGIPDDVTAVVVLSGDVPLLTADTVRLLLDAVGSGAAAAMLTAVVDPPGGYGRVVRGSTGRVSAIVEARDADEATLAIAEVNAGVYAFARPLVDEALAELTPDNAQGEYYLTDVVAWMTGRGHGVEAVVLDDAAEMHGVNSRSDLAEVGRLVVDRHLDALMASGVTVIGPAATWIDDSCRLEAEVVIEPGVVLTDGCIIGGGATIGANSVLRGATVAAGEAVPPLTRRDGSTVAC